MIQALNPRIKFLRWISPDLFLGRVLVGAKSKLELIWLLVSRPSKPNLQFARLVLSVKPKFTMVKNRNLWVLYNLGGELNSHRVPGDIVECGVWNGGSAAILAAASLDAPFQKEVRMVWLFDSFQGLPPPGEKDGVIEKENYFSGWNKGNIKLVKEVFRKIGYPRDKLRIVPGWFNETLDREPIKDIAILHIDADWYDSVKTALQVFYDRVVPGGFVVLDDYGLWQGCRSAVLDYFSENHISEMNVKKIGNQGAYFQKPKNVI
jgi:O-methyltransferase